MKEIMRSVLCSVFFVYFTILGTHANVNVAPYLCILPLGDSLTQGVTGIGSYRSHLDTMLTQLAATDHSPISGHRFIGVQDNHCPLRNPFVDAELKRQYSDKKIAAIAKIHSAFNSSHMGFCGWTSHRLLDTFTDIVSDPKSNENEGAIQKWKTNYQNGMRSCEIAALEANGKRPIMTVLLLFGHNDGFIASRKCRLERYAQRTTQEKRECVEKNLQKFRHTIGATLSALEEEFMRRLELPLLVLLGLNPPFYFSVLDELLHRYLEAEVNAWLKSKENGKGNSDLFNINVRFVTFKGWQKEWTFDSTHPNHIGCAKMAESWIKELQKYVDELHGSSRKANMGKLSSFWNFFVESFAFEAVIILIVILLLLSIFATRRVVARRFRRRSSSLRR